MPTPVSPLYTLAPLADGRVAAFRSESPLFCFIEPDEAAARAAAERALADHTARFGEPVPGDAPVYADRPAALLPA